MTNLGPKNVLSRRRLLQIGSCGFGYTALAGLVGNYTAANDFENPLSAKRPHFDPKAKRVIFMFMQGGPSHIDTFDHKPELEEIAGKSGGGKKNLMSSPWQFAPHGESGIQVSELFPYLGEHVDDICFVNSMHTDSPAHPQATIMIHTGAINFVRPSMGSWVVYGLGSENENLPGFVALNPLANLGGAQNYGSAFLPATYQGTRMQANPKGLVNVRRGRDGSADQRRQLDLIQSMNRRLYEQTLEDQEIDGVIQSFELAFRMQSAVPEVMDISAESAATKVRYGIGNRSQGGFGSQCLMARRLAEAGVRFIEITHRGWDHHGGLKAKLPASCQNVDQPIAALIRDLKDRDMLKDTLLVWGGEFGRTPEHQNNGDGRRHNHRGFTVWLAGGGVSGGVRHGATDPTGLEAIENKVHTHDLHATILHLLGLDHEKLTYRYAGRDFRLTDVYGNVVSDIVG